MKTHGPLLLFISFCFSACAGEGKQQGRTETKTAAPKTQDEPQIVPGADQMAADLPLLKGTKVGLMGNQTAIVGAYQAPLVDVLLAEGVDLRLAVAPEHGFRGDIERGEKVDNAVDRKTGLP